MKTCPKCNTPKPLDEFHKASHRGDGRSGICKECMKAYGKTPQAIAYKAAYRKREYERVLKPLIGNWKKTPRGRKSALDYKKRKKQTVFDHYGHVCACPGCNVTEFEFLTIDHISGNGHKHRKELGGQWVYTWLIVKMTFRQDFSCFVLTVTVPRRPNRRARYTIRRRNNGRVPNTRPGL